MSNGREIPKGRPFEGLYDWMHEGMWRTAILHGVLTFFALLVVGEFGRDLWGLFAFGWVTAWLYRSCSDLLAAYAKTGEITRDKLLGEILDVAMPILAILLAALLTAGGT